MGRSKVLKASFWYTFSNFLLKGIGFFTTPIFARVLTKAEYGAYSNFVTWYSIFSIVATISLYASLSRARFEYSEELDSYIASNLLLGTIWTVVLSIIVITNIEYILQFTSMDKRLVFVTCMSVAVSPAYDMFLCVERFQYKYRMVTFLTVLIAVSSTVLSLVLLFIMKDHLFARVIGSYLPAFIVSLILYIYFFLKCKHIEFGYCKYALVIAGPYVFHLLSGVILSSFDKTMITKMVGPEENAMYSMGLTVSTIISTLWVSLDRAFSPWLGENLNAKRFSTIKKYANIYVIGFAYVVFGVILVSPELILILGGNAYFESVYTIPPLLIGNFYMLIYSLYVNVEQYEKKTIGMAIATFLAASTNVVLNYFAIPSFGYVAAAYTTLFCNLLLVVFHYYLVKRMKLGIIYSDKFLIGFAVVTMLCSPVLVWIISHTVFRRVFVMVYLVSILLIVYRHYEIIRHFISNRMNRE